MATTPKKAPEMTASAFSAMMNCDRHELARKLSAINAKPLGTRNGGKLYGLRDLVTAHIGGDEKSERIRKLRAESERLEIQNARAKGELVEVEQISKIVMSFCAGIRQKILASPLPADVQDSILRDLKALHVRDLSH